MLCNTFFCFTVLSFNYFSLMNSSSLLNFSSLVIFLILPLYSSSLLFSSENLSSSPLKPSSILLFPLLYSFSPLLYSLFQNQSVFLSLFFIFPLFFFSSLPICFYIASMNFASSVFTLYFFCPPSHLHMRLRWKIEIEKYVK